VGLPEGPSEVRPGRRGSAVGMYRTGPLGDARITFPHGGRGHRNAGGGRGPGGPPEGRGPDNPCSLTPPPSPLARTAPKLSDGYLYWRIAEGGLAFGTSMPSFGTALTEQDIWDIINFLRTMEAAEDPQAAQRLQEALQQAVEQGVITQEEADLFLQVHDLIEAYRQAHWEQLRGQGSQQGSMIDLILQGLVDSGQIDEATVQRFRDVLQRLQEGIPRGWGGVP